MPKNKYSICMKTPLGLRLGTMSIVTEQHKVSGYLDVLQRSEPFSGEIDGNGNLRISGKIVTLMQTIPYVATGKMSAHSLNLILRGEQGEFEINGAACPTETEITPCEKA